MNSRCKSKAGNIHDKIHPAIVSVCLKAYFLPIPKRNLEKLNGLIASM